MPIIYSSREVDQLLNRIGQQLVRRSNAIEDDYTADIHPEVRRVITQMHLRMPDAFAKLAWMGGPDGYEVSGPNRISAMREIVPGSGDATQGTAADQPERSRDDDKQNLVTHSRLPGTLGAASPDGWSDVIIGTPTKNELVASDDASDGHQAYEVDCSGDRAFLRTTLDVVGGMRIIYAFKAEAITYVSGSEFVIQPSGVARTTLGRNADSVSTITPGTWAWFADQIDGTGSLTLDMGAGVANTTSLFLRFSRPVVAYVPPQSEGGPDLTDNASVQAWLEATYAASGTDHQEFAGYRGLRGIVVPDLDGKHLVGPTINPGGDGWTEFSLAMFSAPRAWPVASQRPFCQGSNQRGIFMTSSQGLRFQWQDAGSNVFNAGSFSLDTADVNVPRLWTGTAKIDDPLRLYQDATEVAASAAIPSFVDNSGAIDISDGTLPYFGDAFWEFVFQRQLTASEVPTLHSIITDT